MAEGKCNKMHTRQQGNVHISTCCAETREIKEASKSVFLKGCESNVSSSDKGATGTRECVFFFCSAHYSVWMSFKECPARVTILCGFQNMLPSLVATQHLPRPLMKLMTLALLQHTAAPSIVGKEDMVSRVCPELRQIAR